MDWSMSVVLSFFCVVSLCLELNGAEDQSRGDAEGLKNAALKKNHFWCPKRCLCSMQERIIDCSSLGLKQVPILPSSTKRVYLHNNLISLLATRHFRSLDQLTYLIIGGNRIKTLNPEIFKDLVSLKYLILDGNNISSLSPDSFKYLRDIETISVAKNQLEVLPGDLLVHNSQLALLNLQGNTISRVHQDAFKGVQHLTTLNLEDNQLDDHVFDALQGLDLLTTLKLGNNRISKLPAQGLSFQSLKHLALHSNAITKLPRTLMKNCSTLETLTMNQNSIEEISGFFFTSCSSLSKVYLQKNRVKYVHPGIFSAMDSVKEIYLCNNQLKNVQPGVFHDLNHLVSIHLENNEISFITEGTFVELPALEAIYLHRNSLSHIQPGAFGDLPRLKHLVLYKNKLRMIRPSVLTSLNSLQRIQIDPLKCSCALLPLVTWLHSRHLKGISCINDSGEIFTITSLQELCHGLQGNDSSQAIEMSTDNVYPGSYFGQAVEDWKSSRGHPASLITSKRWNRNSQPRVEVLKRVLLKEKGPPVHPTNEEKLGEVVKGLEEAVSELQNKVLKLETLFSSDSHFCLRKVCVFEGVRLLVGDEWKTSDGRLCSCLHDGSVDCNS